MAQKLFLSLFLGCTRNCYKLKENITDSEQASISSSAIQRLQQLPRLTKHFSSWIKPCQTTNIVTDGLM